MIRRFFQIQPRWLVDEPEPSGFPLSLAVWLLYAAAVVILVVAVLR